MPSLHHPLDHSSSHYTRSITHYMVVVWFIKTIIYGGPLSRRWRNETQPSWSMSLPLIFHFSLVHSNRTGLLQAVFCDFNVPLKLLVKSQSVLKRWGLLQLLATVYTSWSITILSVYWLITLPEWFQQTCVNLSTRLITKHSCLASFYKVDGIECAMWYMERCRWIPGNIVMI